MNGQEIAAWVGVIGAAGGALYFILKSLFAGRKETEETFDAHRGLIDRCLALHESHDVTTKSLNRTMEGLGKSTEANTKAVQALTTKLAVLEDRQKRRKT